MRLFYYFNGRARLTTTRPTQLVDIFEVKILPAGKNLRKLTVLVTEKQLTVHEISRRTGHTRAFLKKQMRNFGLESPHSTGGYGPYGWDYKGKELVKNTKEQKVLCEILRLNETGLGCKSIAKILNERKVVSKGGTRWNPSSVQCILNRHTKQKEK